MILDLKTLGNRQLRPRVVVLGAGAVGIVLAVSLARAGVPVLLCETGGATHEPAAQALNEAVVAGRPHLGISEGRARVLGGTTTLWGGQLIAFREIDFAPRPWLGLNGWPIRRSDLAPYYVAVASMLGLPVRDDDDSIVWRSLGMARPNFGDDLELIITRWLKEPNLARVFAKDLRENPNLTVLLHATATGFTPDPGGTASAQRIMSTTLKSPDGRTTELHAEEFVLATGTIEASRLMLASAAARPELVWAKNRWVGRAFQDHLDLRAGDVTPIDRKRFGDAFDNIFLKGFKYNPKIMLAQKVQETHETTNVAAGFIFESSLTEHLSNLKIFLKAMRNGGTPPNLRSMPSHLIALAKVWWPLILRYMRDNRAFNPSDLGIGLRLHCEQRPLMESAITLDLARCNSLGVPLAVLDWRVDGRELDAMAEFTERLRAKLEQQGLARIAVDPRISARDPSILAEATDTNHHCGGLQMGRTADHGVVDRDLRVHGTANLHVAGAATFPSSSFANPTFTAMALALRLSERLSDAP